MSRYTKGIAIAQNGDGYRVTITDSIGEENPTPIVLDFPDLEAMQAYTDAEIRKAGAEKDLHETLLLRADRQRRAWFRELNALNLNTYYDRERANIFAWLTQFNLRYVNPQNDRIDCSVDENGFVRSLEDNSVQLRIAPDSRRRIRARVPGAGNEQFEVLSEDERFYSGRDVNNDFHRLRIIKKQ